MGSTVPRSGATARLLGRAAILAEMDRLLRTGHNVLLYGPADIGKSALIAALDAPGVHVADPFEHVTPHLAAHIRRDIERGATYVAAARSLDRSVLGAVRRIAWCFSTLRVPPLPGRSMHELIRYEISNSILRGDDVPPAWTHAVAQLADGRPGVALAMVRAAARIRTVKGSVPSASVAYVEARIRRAAEDSFVQIDPEARF